MLKPGYIPGHEIVVIAPDGQFAAFAKMWLDELNEVGYFEPVSVHKDFQRRGFGRAIMLHGMHEMKRLDMQTVQVNYETDNPGASGLYTHLGFRKKYDIMDYTKS